MQAMLLAAGRGDRLRPLTNQCPKPLLKVGGKALIEWHLEKLAAAGFSDIVINVAYLGAQIQDYCQDGQRWGLAIQYSVEPEPLETASGIAFALPWLQDLYFTVISADIFTSYAFDALARRQRFLIEMAEKAESAKNGPCSSTADQNPDFHLLLVEKPPYLPANSWGVDCGEETNLLRLTGPYTYAGLGVFRRACFTSIRPADKVPLRDIFTKSVVNSRVTGEVFHGYWADVGTPERLIAVDHHLKQGIKS